MLITGSKGGWNNFFKLRCPQYALDVRNKSRQFFKSKKDFANYVDGKAGFKEEKIVTDKLTEIYKSLEPNASDIDIEKKVMDMDKSK